MTGLLIWILLIVVFSLIKPRKGKVAESASSSVPVEPSQPVEYNPFEGVTPVRKAVPKAASRPVLYTPVRIVEDEPAVIDCTPEPATELSAAESCTGDPVAGTAGGSSPSSREAHFARWRQAFLDSQILERKF